MTNDLIGILGAVITFLLSVNLYYFKDVIRRLVKIELEIAKLSTHNLDIYRTIERHEEEIDRLHDRLNRLIESE